MKHRKWRSLRAALGLVLVAVATVIACVLVPQQASAESLGYPNAGKPCIWHPYNVEGKCKHNGVTTYEWGDGRDDPSGANIYSSRGYANRNCTDYVAWKLQSLGVPDSLTRGLGNGGQWYDKSASKQGLTRGTEPKVGAAAVVPDSTPGFGSYGHVAYVEEVHDDGTITISEYNYTLDGTGGHRRGTPAGMKFTQFVYFGPHMTNPPSNSGGSSGGGNPLENGKFVSYNNAVYRIAGGAPLYVSGPDAGHPDLSGWATATVIDAAQWASLSPFPADGTYLSDVQTGAVYITAGGAPMYISGADAPYLPNWTNATRVPHWDFEHWQRLRQFPADGYYIRDVQSGFVYNTAGGAPFYVSGQDAPLMPQWQYATPVPHWEFVNFQHLRNKPADGAYISDVQTGAVYITLGGAPMYISGADAAYLPGWAGATRVSHWEFQNWAAIKPYPADGYYLRDVQTNAVYITAGGAPLYVSGQNAQYLPQWQYASPVPHWELENWGRLRQLPADGTYLIGTPSNKVFQVTGGVAVQVTPGPVATRVDDWAIVNQLGGTV